jgi:hypothetical protein
MSEDVSKFTILQISAFFVVGLLSTSLYIFMWNSAFLAGIATGCWIFVTLYLGVKLTDKSRNRERSEPNAENK